MIKFMVFFEDDAEKAFHEHLKYFLEMLDYKLIKQGRAEKALADYWIVELPEHNYDLLHMLSAKDLYPIVSEDLILPCYAEYFD